MKKELHIKVRVPELIAAIEKRKAEAEREHVEATKNHAKNIKEWQTKALERLAQITAEVKAGKNPDPTEYYRNYRCEITLPTFPVLPTLDVSEYERSIGTLKLAAEDTVTISQDDYARYIR